MATEHINGNGPEEPMDTSAAVTHSEHFQTLLEAGLPQKVAEKLDEIYIAGKAQWIYLHIEICNFQCSIFFCMYCHFYHLFEWGNRLPKQLFVVSYQNGYCSATKWLNYKLPVWKCVKYFSICIPNMIELVSGRMDKNLFNPHVFTTKCCLYSALINLIILL